MYRLNEILCNLKLKGIINEYYVESYNFDVVTIRIYYYINNVKFYMVLKYLSLTCLNKDDFNELVITQITRDYCSYLQSKL